MGAGAAYAEPAFFKKDMDKVSAIETWSAQCGL